MDANFTQLDLDRLSHAIRAASRPFAAQTVDEWRAEVLRACTELIDGHMGHFDLFGLGLDDPHLVDGYPAGIFDEWRGRWGPESDAAIDVTAHLNMTVFTRQHRFRLAGHHWTARYKRSALYADFYTKHRLFHAGGLHCRSGDITAYLLIESEALANDAFDERARRLLHVVEPVFQSGIRSLARGGAGYWSTGALFNALDEPIALATADGQWVHRSPAFETALAAIPVERRPRFLAEVLTRSRALLTATAQTSKRSREPSKSVKPTWTSDVFTVSLTTFDAPGDPEPTCLVRLQPRGGASLEQAAAAGLTERESIVALCLVDGMSNDEIAQRLAISPHTARRHTESILRKLGITSRASVARALRGGRAE